MRKKSSSPLDQALNFLSYRPRSEAEVAAFLKRKRITPDEISTTIAKLKDNQFIDDHQFATWWQQSRDGSKPVGAAMLKQELRHKGIVPSIIAEIIDESIATECHRATAALAKKRQFALREDTKIKHQAIQFLARRGFSWSIIQQVLLHTSD